MIVLACSLPAERRALGGLAGPGVTLAVSGVGPDRAPLLAARILADRPRAVIAVGFCGALRPGLALGEAVAAERVVDARDGASFPADPELLAATAARRGVLVSTPHLVRGAGERAALDGTVVDMESATLARAAAEAGVAFLALRAVTDAVDDALPDLDDMVGPGGRPRLGRLAWLALTRPGALTALRRLQSGASLAGAGLEQATASLLARVTA